MNGVFGTRGWVKIHSYTRPRDNILAYRRWDIATPSGWRTHNVAESRRQGNSIIACLEDITDRDAAIEYVSRDVAVAREMLPPNEAGEYYWHDLVGLRVSNRQGVDLGRVVQLLDTGANDVLVVEGDRKRLIPYVPGVHVDDVDLADGRISVDWHADD
ncbi:MAG: ribosome maturation factor RimM [Gammaproteobacteria bacterium]